MSSAHPHSELRQLEWRAEVTKARRADVIPLHDPLAAELAAFRPKEPAPADRVVPDVPDMKVLKLDLAHAKIDYGSKEIGFADLHSMRMTLNNLLAASKVGSRTRQAQLRHADPELTEVTYFDKSLYLQPHAEQLDQVAAIPSRFAAVTPAGGAETGFVRAQNAHKAGEFFGARRGTGWHNERREWERVGRAGRRGKRRVFGWFWHKRTRPGVV